MFTSNDYEVGALIEYRLAGGSHRRVRVTDKVRDIQPGHHGFDGVTQDGKTVWGYDDQITRILDPMPFFVLIDDRCEGSMA